MHRRIRRIRLHQRHHLWRRVGLHFCQHARNTYHIYAQAAASLPKMDIPLQPVMRLAGDTLLYLPNHYAPDMSENEKAVCTACECYALAWMSDICGTIPTMLAIEPREAHDSLSTFAKYTLCWPCRLVYGQPVNKSPYNFESRDAELDTYLGYIQTLRLSDSCCIPYPWPIRKLF